MKFNIQKKDKTNINILKQSDISYVSLRLVSNYI